ncbi:hypothetical protein LCGC14_0673940, partial [marine sediment metagenome]
NIRMHFTRDTVLEPGEKPDGFYIIKSLESAVMILKLCVHPLRRCTGAGSNLLHDIEQYALDTNRKLIVINVHEMNLCTIYWLQTHGYKAVRIDKELYPDGRDGYAFYKEIT